MTKRVEVLQWLKEQTPACPWDLKVIVSHLSSFFRSHIYLCKKNPTVKLRRFLGEGDIQRAKKQYAVLKYICSHPQSRKSEAPKLLKEINANAKYAKELII